MKPMTVEQLFAAVAKARENAKELVEEAEILLERQRYARAFTLAQLASEELTKTTAFVTMSVQVQRGKPFKWDKVDNALRDHVKKTEGALFMDYMRMSHSSVQADVAVLLKDTQAAGRINTLKKQSLYVTRVSDGYVKPSETISAQLAADWVERARSRLIRTTAETSLLFVLAGTSGERLQQLLEVPENEAFFQRAENQTGGIDAAKLPSSTMEQILTDPRMLAAQPVFAKGIDLMIQHFGGQVSEEALLRELKGLMEGLPRPAADPRSTAAE